jgi:Xaa-Pro aminopeptidase
VQRRIVLGFALLLSSNVFTLSAQSGFTDAFQPAEFAARRAKVMEKIGDGIAVIQGSAEWPGYVAFRQNAQFFYLTGVEVPRAVLVIDGKAHSSTLFLAATYRLANSEGPILLADDVTRRITGVEHVMARDSVIPVLTRLAQEGRPIYAPFRSESRNAGAPEQSRGFEAASLADPLDGRPSRERVLVDKLKSLSGKAVQNLDSIVDSLRIIKSPAEIAVIREATRIAQLGLMEAMRSAQPGMYEYQLAAIADYEFRNNGAQGEAYFALASTGTNAAWPHYHALKSQLGPSELVLFDYAPDYKYYQSDVTREFPSSGKFTPRQREMYTIYLRLYQALETSMKVGAAPRDIIRDAVVKMDKVMTGFTFSDPRIKEAATRFVNGYRNNQNARSLGHMVGLETHDVSAPFDVLQPGMVFTLEPALTIPDERAYVRIENVYLITPSGYENLSAMAPVEPDAIEKLMRETGIGELQGATKANSNKARP